MPPIDVDALEDEWDRGGADRARSRTGRGGGGGEPGRVVRVDRGAVQVALGDEVISARFAGSMRGESLVAGDHVRVRRGRAIEDARVVAKLPRETELLRTADDTSSEERVLVANAERAVIVVAGEDPEGGGRFVDRILVAAQAGGLDAAVCVNKVDLGLPIEDLAGRYESLGLPVVLTSAKTGHGLDDLRRLLDGRWSVLTGHSGSGKTSLFNRLVPDADRAVAEVGRRGGRHTTVASVAMKVPGTDGGWLVDTPGVRTFGLGALSPRDLAGYFPELNGHGCAHADCAHDGDEGCAVPPQVGVTIHPERYDSYLRLLTSLRGT